MTAKIALSTDILYQLKVKYISGNFIHRRIKLCYISTDISYLIRWIVTSIDSIESQPSTLIHPLIRVQQLKVHVLMGIFRILTDYLYFITVAKLPKSWFNHFVLFLIRVSIKAKLITWIHFKFSWISKAFYSLSLSLSQKSLRVFSAILSKQQWRQ